jgi:hypothetical protein
VLCKKIYILSTYSKLLEYTISSVHISPTSDREKSVIFLLKIPFRLLTSVFSVRAPTYVPESLPPSLPPYMLPFHFLKDKMEFKEEIDCPTKITAMEGKSTYKIWMMRGLLSSQRGSSLSKTQATTCKSPPSFVV